MLNKIINIFILLFLISSCNRGFNETALLTPPNLHQMPEEKNINKKDQKINQESKVTQQDIADIKKLLLE